MAAYKILSPTPTILKQMGDRQTQLKEEIKNQTFFKIVFTSPFVYDRHEPIVHLFNRGGFTMISCVLGKPLPIGGFDMEAKKPKPMVKGLSAGSVFILHKEAGVSLDYFEESLHLELSRYRPQGFNQFYFTQYSKG